MIGQVIHIGADPEPFQAQADFFDGKSAGCHRVNLTIEDDGGAHSALVITFADGQVHRWPFADIRRVPDQAGRDGLVLRLFDDVVSRLVISNDKEVETGLVSRCPNLTKRRKVRGKMRLLGWAVGAIASAQMWCDQSGIFPDKTSAADTTIQATIL